MPIYGYECEQCGHQFEVFQSMSDAPLRECPECKGALHKKLYPVGVVFKGSGFYTTDYKAGGNGSKSESGSDAKSEAKPESKPDSKAESKAESKPAEKSASTAD